MPASIIKYTDKEGNKKTYVGDPRHFKKPKEKKGGGKAYGKNS